jgi:MORN repeat protein
MIRRIALILILYSCISCAEKKKSSIEIIKFDPVADLVLPIVAADSVRYVPRVDGDTAICIYNSKKHELRIISKSNRGVSSIIKKKNDVRIFVGEYYPNGQLKGKISLNEKGEMDGKVTYYYEDGRIKSSGQFASGKKTGPWEKFDEQGYLISSKE